MRTFLFTIDISIDAKTEEEAYNKIMEEYDVCYDQINFVEEYER